MSALYEKLHFDAGNFEHVMIVERMRLGVRELAIHDRELRPFDVSHKIALRTTRNHGYLCPRLTQGRQVLGQFDFTACVSARQNLQCA